MLGHGGSSAGLYLADPTSPIPSHCAVIILFQSVPVHKLSWLALWELTFIHCFSSNGGKQSGPQPLVQWSEVANHPGLVCSMTQSNNNPVILMITPQSILIQEIKVLPAKAKVKRPLRKKATIHQATTLLATSKNVLFPGHNHLLNRFWWPDTLIITLAGTWAIIKVSGYQYQWLAGGYDLEIGHFIWWIVAFVHGVVFLNDTSFHSLKVLVMTSDALEYF